MFGYFTMALQHPFPKIPKLVHHCNSIGPLFPGDGVYCYFTQSLLLPQRSAHIPKGFHSLLQLDEIPIAPLHYRHSFFAVRLVYYPRRYPHSCSVLLIIWRPCWPDSVGITTSTTILIPNGVAIFTSTRMDSFTSPITPGSSQIPLELLQQIYQLLSPLDFDAARHSCRLWLFASLDKTLLTSKLVVGGWQVGAEQELQEAADYFGRTGCRSAGISACEHNPTFFCRNVSTEWILSKRLAAETRLCPTWRCIWPSYSRNERQLLDRGVGVQSIQSPVMKQPPLQGASASMPPANFTVSGCGRFVLLAQARVIFLYSLENFKSGLRPQTSIFCHRRVVKVSMDTSCGRYAVAILLEGRTGMCCEVKIGPQNPPNTNSIHPSMSLSDFRNFDVRTTSRPHLYPPSRVQTTSDLSSPNASRFCSRAQSFGRRGHPFRQSEDVTFIRGSSLRLTDSNFHNVSGEEFNPPVPNVSLNRFFPQRSVDDPTNDSLSQHYPFDNYDPITAMSVPIQLGARRFYKNLCSIRDPPQSVAICPQRQCVAFGCKTGVELHWIDALRGTTLSR